MDGKATLLELQTVYSLRDAVRLYTAIDIGSTINNVLYEVKKKE